MDKPTYRMSSAGKCPRALSAQRQDYEAEPIPSFVMQAAEEGSWHEERIKEKLRASGIQVYDEQREFTLDYPTFQLTGHIDGIAEDGKHDTRLLEIKTMSQFEFDRWMKGGFKAFPNYADQLTCYMEATGLSECLYIVKNRSSGYEDRQVLTKQPSDMNAIIKKIAGIEDWLAKWVEPGAREGVYPADFDPNSIECRRCEFKHLCVPEPKELTPVEEIVLNVASDDWRHGKELVAEGQEMIDRAKTAFDQHTRATGIDRWGFNKLAIQLVHYNKSVTYPKAKLLKAFTEEQLEPVSQVKEAFDQLRITDLEKDK